MPARYGDGIADTGAKDMLTQMRYYEKDYKRRKGADADQPTRIKYRRIDA